MVVSSSTPARLPSEPIMLTLSIILFFKTTLILYPEDGFDGEFLPMFSPFFFDSGAKSKVLSITATLLAQIVVLLE